MSHYDTYTGYDDSAGWVVVDGLTNPKTSDEELARLWRMATPNERAEAQRRLKEEIAERREKADVLRRRLDEMVTRFPELKSVSRRRRGDANKRSPRAS
jgi:hypothetical protein